MEPDGRGIGRGTGRPPNAGRQHRRLVVLGDRRIAGCAMVGRRLRFALVPLEPLENEHLCVPAMGAWHEVATLVRSLVLALYAREALHGRRRDQAAPCADGRRSASGPRPALPDRLPRRPRPDRRRPRPTGCSAPGSSARPTAELAPVMIRMPPANSFDSMVLPESRDRAGLTRLRLAPRFPRSADRCAGGSSVWPAPPSAGPPGHRPRRLVDDEADEVIGSLCGADLSRLHEHHAAARIGRR